MSDSPHLRDYLEKLTGELRKTRAKLRETEERAREPIAIVGIGCRFPGGVGSPDELWELLESKAPTVGDFPTDRGWDLDALLHPDPDHPGTTYARTGSFVYDAGHFDAGFFDIGPREALAMDPQQRMVLEVAWDALEHAGIEPLALRGSEVGVFTGGLYYDYADATRAQSQLEGLRLTGTAGSVISGRIAYTLGLEGPTVTIDTACSSSLVAIHLACDALRGGACSLALAGGVTVIASPMAFIEFSRQRGLAADGCCKPFAAGADGTAWGEGAGLLVLERLSDAQRHGHSVLAVLRGSAFNHDGASNGLTAPNGPSQERVIRRALAAAGLTAGEVDVVEAHGTGTAMGDPIEAEALLATYGQGREAPLWLGAVKSNLGHTQAAAGVAGVIKMALSMQHSLLPATLHVDAPSSEVDWDAGNVRLLTDHLRWPRATARARRAGVSAFGIGGTNAHVIVEEAPDAVERPVVRSALDSVAWVLSAKTPSALAAQAERLQAHVERHANMDALDVAYSLAVTRSRFEHRAAVIGGDDRELRDGLRALARGEPAAGVTRGAAGSEGKVAFMFTGQGAQHPGMARGLYDAFPAFAAAFDAACGELDRQLDRPLKELVFAADGSGPGALLDRTEYTQPALFAVEVALYRLLVSFGVRPDYLIGHSIGELVAAHVAEALSLVDACALVAARGRLMGALPAGGGMASVVASEDEVCAELPAWNGRLELAAVNAPRAIVVSGDADAVDAWAAQWEARDRKVRRLRVGHAFHSHRMEPAIAEFRSIAAALSFDQPAIPIASNVTGAMARGEELRSADYWARHAREPVRFAAGIHALRAAGAASFIEIGPDAVLSALARQCTIANEDDASDLALAAPSLRRGRPDVATLMRCLGEAHVHGVPVDFGAVYGGQGARRVALPTYAFERTRYWVEDRARSARVTTPEVATAGHPLLTAAMSVAADERSVFTGRLTLQGHPWLADHTVFDTVLLPGTAFVELALHAAEKTDCDAVEELVLEAPLPLPATEAVDLQVAVGRPDQTGRREIAIHARPADDPDHAWRRHAQGTLTCVDANGAVPDLERLEVAWPPRADFEPVDVDAIYERLEAVGFGYGLGFRGATEVWRRGNTIAATVVLPQAAGEAGAFAVHPALLDAALHTASAASAEGEEVALPFAWHGVRVAGGPAGGTLRVLSERVAPNTIALTATDDAGTPVITIDRLVVRPVERGELDPSAQRRDLYALTWEPLPRDATSASRPTIAIVGQAAPDLDGATRHDGIPELRHAIAGGASVPDVIVTSSASAGGPAAAAGTVLELLQESLNESMLESARIAVLTAGAVSADTWDTPDPALAACWGLTRSAQVEHPERILLIDVDDDLASRDAIPHALAAAIALGEAQLAMRRGDVLAPRLGTVLQDRFGAMSAHEPWRLVSERVGSFDELEVVAAPDAARELVGDEVRIAVRAAGMNFRDVLVALGRYPGDASLGNEGAGVVTGIGPDVRDLQIGDRVFGLMERAFGSAAIATRGLVATVPSGMPLTTAAGVPLVFLTAYCALRDLADLRSGERVLIHAGAGGVGMAAIQIARHLGAEVFATAHPSKWDTLRSLGVDDAHLASSRSLDFEDRFLTATRGGGVDVVLNSLAGEFVDASLRLLPRGGRFVELGVADLREASRVAAADPGVVYQRFEFADIGAPRLGDAFEELLALLDRGALEPLPTTVRDVRDAGEALRFVSHGRHVGKVVLSVPQPLDRAGTVLVTGGTGGLGTHIARHLVQTHGVRKLVLASRRGSDAPGAAQLREELVALGAEVRLAACDVSDRDELARLVDRIERLSGVVHAAGVIDDAALESLDQARVERVMAPKADAALWLDELTRQHDLAWFVLFSSAAGVLGSPGQANYAAANAALDALALRRRAHGLPACSLAWGRWGGPDGMAGRLRDQDRARVARFGLDALPAEHALALFDAAVVSDRALLLPMRLDRRGLQERGSDRVPTPLRGLLGKPAASAGKRGGSLASRLAAAPEPERQRLVQDIVRAETATVLSDGGAAIDLDRSFQDLGLDSMGAVELRNRLRAVTDLQLPSTLVFDYPTPAAVAALLATKFAGKVRNQPRRRAARGQDGGDAIAIVGIGCRFPGGVASPAALWELLDQGRSVEVALPSDRGWDLERLYDPDPDHRGTTYVRRGAFLDDAGAFDAAFFGIGPREAVAMDPQQRLLLECAWESFEHAGIDPQSLRGTATGVFAGVMQSSYGLDAIDELEGMRLTGAAASVASGRIAYRLGLEGPAISIDTACSSSLAAIHLASQSLRTGECELALAGGVGVISTIDALLEFSRQRMLAPDGRCKAFAAGANGFAIGEGAGLLVLERVSDAQRAGRAILAVVRGSAMNQDGASNGLTAPSGPAQERVILDALARAGLAASDVDAVEAHGTGTELGDPIEAGALLATYGRDRRDGALWLGSIKSNIGHTQAAAGVAGVIKMVMALRHGVLPPTLHAAAPSPHVDWSAGSIELLTERVEWPARPQRPRRAGVSSFGVSGTNAHLVLEEAPVEPTRTRADRPDGAVTAWTLSARSDASLSAQAQRLRSHLLARQDLSPSDVGYSLARRSRLEHRAVVVGSDRDALLTGLDAVAQDRAPANGALGRARGDGAVAFVFSGQGAQHAGMGAALYDEFDVFARAFDAVCVELDDRLGRSLRRLAFEGDDAMLAETQYTQPAVFALEVALFRLLESFGVRPDYVIGHSVGELAAMHAACALSLAEACGLVAARGRAMSGMAEGGAMVSVRASESEVRERLRPFAGRIDVAAINGPEAVVVSGDRDALEEWLTALDGIATRWLSVSHAFHSHRIHPILDDLRDMPRGIATSTPNVPIVSTVTGALLDGGELASPDYWARQAREPVRFMDGIRYLESVGVRRFIALGPDGSLCAPARESLATEDALVTSLLRADRPEPASVLTALAQASTDGLAVDWDALYAPTTPSLVELPTYAFERQRYWVTSARRSLRATETLLSFRWEPVNVSESGARVAALGAPDLWPGLDGECHAGLAELANGHDALPALVLVRVASDASMDDLADCACGAAQRVLELVREWLDTPVLAGAQLAFVTQGAVKTRESELVDPVAAAIWGVVRSFQAEHPERFVLVDTDLDAAAAALVRGARAGEAAVAIRGGETHAPRLTDQRSAARLAATGRTGLLVWTGSAADATAASGQLANADLGAQAIAVTDPAQLDGPSLRGTNTVVRFLWPADADETANNHPERFAELLAPRLRCALRLDALTAGADAPVPVLLSASAGLVGSPRRVLTGAADAFVGALMQRRHERGLGGVVLTCRSGDDPVDPAGLELLPAERGLALLGDMSAPLVVAARTEVDGRLPAAFHDQDSGERGAPTLPERLAVASELEHDAILLESVREAVAAVLGYATADAVPAERTLLEVGLDSLGAIELRDRLARASGLQLDRGMAFEHPTPVAIAAYLHGEFARAEHAVASVGNGDGPATLTGLVREAHRRGDATDAVALLVHASRLRPAFQGSADLNDEPTTLTLSTTAAPLRLICLPSFAAGSGPQQYARFAAALGGRRSVSVIPLPGFVPGDALPATWSAAVNALAASVRRTAAGEPYILVGYSSGGYLAHALAQSLEHDPSAPRAVVTIDTEAPHGMLEPFAGRVLGELLERDNQAVVLDDDNLIAMGGYIRLYGEWEATAIEAPVLALRATQGLARATDEMGPLPALQRTFVEITGDHYTIIEQHVDATADCIEEWLTEFAERHGYSPADHRPEEVT